MDSVGALSKWRLKATVWRTGAVINSKYIEPRRFLENASEIVFEHVHSIMQRWLYKNKHCFNGMFVASDKRTNKNIATRNYELYQCTDLLEWYVSRIIEPTLSSFSGTRYSGADGHYRVIEFNGERDKHNPLRMECHIKLRRKIMLKRAVINVQTADNACFA